MNPKTFLACALLLFASTPAFPKGGLHPHHSRWPIKTSIRDKSRLDHPKEVSLDALLNLKPPPDVAKNDPRYNANYIPHFENFAKLDEGDIVVTTGWLHVAAFEEDGDYHLQISPSKEGGEPCLIVEIPMPEPEFVADDDLRPMFRKAREFVQSRLPSGEPREKEAARLDPPVHVRVTGQLFYDDAHVEDVKPRGKLGMKSHTLWEIHPVTKIESVQ